MTELNNNQILAEEEVAEGFEIINSEDALELAHLLTDAISDKKASDIIILDLLGRSVLTDYFLLCTAENKRQLQAIATAVVETAKQDANIIAMGREGTAESGWMLIDFGDLIVHIFSPEQRLYYRLEELWHESHVVLRMP